MVGLRPPERDIGVLDAPIRSCLALLGLFAVAFLTFTLLERLGLNPDFIPVGVIISALAISVLAAIAAHGRRPADYYIADRSIRPAVGGMAAASGVAGLLVIGIAGGAFATAAEFVVSAAGFLLGLLVLGLLFAPGLQRFPAFSATDFLAARFGGNAARLGAAAVAFTSSFLLLIAHLETSGPLLSTLLNLTPEQGLYIVTGLTLCAVLPGGMRSLTWTQIVQFFLIAAACLLPAGILSAIAAAEGSEAGVAPALDALVPTLIGPLQVGAWGAALLPILVLAAGTASLSPFLARLPVAPSARQAGRSMIWAVMSATMLVAGSLVLAQVLASQPGAVPVSGLGGDPLLLATPIFAAMPSVLAGLVMAGFLAALLAIGQASLLSAAGALSHDLWDALVDSRAPEGRRLLIARIIATAVVIVAALLGLRFTTDPPALIGWALAIAAGGTFVPLLLGMYWRGFSEMGGLFAMATGPAVVAIVFLLEVGMPAEVSGSAVPSGLGPIGAAAVAMLAALAVGAAVSLLRRGRDPSGRVQNPSADPRAGRDNAPVEERPA